MGGVCLAEFGGIAVGDEGEGAEVLLNSQNLLKRILKDWRELRKLLVGIESGSIEIRMETMGLTTNPVVLES